MDPKKKQEHNYQHERDIVLRDLQHPKVLIDRKCWAKTPEEKEQLKNIKSIWKTTQRKEKTQRNAA